MDGPTARVVSNGSKRRSPPPQNRSRPQSPSPAIQASVNGKASSSAYTTRTAAISRNAYAAPNGLGAGPSELEDTLDGPGVMVDISAEGAPEYAYSTTLRRQPSMEQGIFPRSSSPHRASPYRNRASSNPYASAIPLDNMDEGYSSRPADEGVLDRVMKIGKKMIGREDYAEVRQQEEEAAGARIRRQQETPSSIYAHKTVEVSLIAYQWT